jgi:hypothetical protein
VPAELSGGISLCAPYPRPSVFPLEEFDPPREKRSSARSFWESHTRHSRCSGSSSFEYTRARAAHNVSAKVLPFRKSIDGPSAEPSWTGFQCLPPSLVCNNTPSVDHSRAILLHLQNRLTRGVYHRWREASLSTTHHRQSSQRPQRFTCDQDLIPRKKSGLLIDEPNVIEVELASQRGFYLPLRGGQSTLDAWVRPFHLTTLQLRLRTQESAAALSPGTVPSTIRTSKDRKQLASRVRQHPNPYRP